MSSGVYSHPRLRGVTLVIMNVTDAPLNDPTLNRAVPLPPVVTTRCPIVLPLQERRQDSRSGSTDTSGRLRLRQGSVHARVERLEAARRSDYAAFGAIVSDVVIGVIERHVADRTLQRAIRSDIATDILALSES